MLLAIGEWWPRMRAKWAPDQRCRGHETPLESQIRLQVNKSKTEVPHRSYHVLREKVCVPSSIKVPRDSLCGPCIYHVMQARYANATTCTRSRACTLNRREKVDRARLLFHFLHTHNYANITMSHSSFVRCSGRIIILLSMPFLWVRYGTPVVINSGERKHVSYTPNKKGWFNNLNCFFPFVHDTKLL